MQETQETQVWSWGQEDNLEKGMATHPRIFVWKIPWTEEPGRLQSIASQEWDVTEHEFACRSFQIRGFVLFQIYTQEWDCWITR